MNIQIKDIKKDQVFFERFSDGSMHQFTAITEPKREISSVGVQWSLTATNTTNNEIGFLVTEGLEHYGPRLYTTKNG